jgi:ATP-dependent Clp protease ATP-binding subunit ClpA
MFERFTKEARAVVLVAQEEAAALDADRIGRGHLLLGLAAEQGAAARVLEPLGLGHAALRAELARSGGALDAQALASIGIDLEEVRRRVEESFGPGALGGARRGRRRFSPGAKKALELALREALALGDRHIGSEHILLGVIRDPGEPLGRVLRARGVEPQAVRPPQHAPPPPADE